jgi:hypothetical protein
MNTTHWRRPSLAVACGAALAALTVAAAATTATAGAATAHAGSGGAPIVRTHDGAQMLSLVPPQPQTETDFTARHHCAFWAAG